MASKSEVEIIETGGHNINLQDHIIIQESPLKNIWTSGSSNITALHRQTSVNPEQGWRITSTAVFSTAQQLDNHES